MEPIANIGGRWPEATVFGSLHAFLFEDFAGPGAPRGTFAIANAYPTLKAAGILPALSRHALQVERM